MPAKWDSRWNERAFYVSGQKLTTIDVDENAMKLQDGFQVALEKYIKKMLSFKIKKVIFNMPATIVYWEDGEKTVVKAHNEPFDREKGLAMAIAKKAFGNKGNFNNIFREWIQ